MKAASHPIILLVALLVFSAPFATALPNTGRRITGTIESVDAKSKEVTMRPEKGTATISFVWIKRTTFSNQTTPSDSSILKKGRRVSAIYHSPFFGKPYVSRVMLLSAATPKNQTK